MPPMNRREALKATTALVGGVLITTNGFLIACARDSSKVPSKVLTLDDQSLIEEIADTLLPTIRELALRAYFSSEIGMTKALRYVMVPGRWVGCVPLAPGQPAWG